MSALTRGAVAIAGSAAVCGSVLISQDEGSRRAATFWLRMAPVYVNYRFVQFLNRDLGVIDNDIAWPWYDRLHESYAGDIEELVWSMRGFYLKQAQLFSTQDDFVPKPYLKWMKKTQSDVPSEFKGDAARKVVAQKMKEELGLDFDEVFSSWEDTPLGVASIGQVHKATLRKSGKKVAVKFLCPGIEPRFRADIATVKSFCAFAMPQHLPPLNEIEKQFMSEFDYRQEAANNNLIRHNMLNRHGYGGDIDIPMAYPELCSKHVLVMDYLEGETLVSGITRQFKELAEANGVPFEQMMAEQKAKMEAGAFRFKSVSEEKRTASWLRAQLWCRDAVINAGKFCYNVSALRLLFGPTEYVFTPPPLNLGSIIETLCKVHATQIFEDGVFNGDCHPGNFMLLKNGKLGLIDFGQVKSLTEEERQNFARLTLAHAAMDKNEVVRLHFDVLKSDSKYRDPDVAYLLSAFYNDRDTDDVLQGKNIAEFVDWLEAQDPIKSIPEQFVMACRVSLLLRGLGKAFGMQFRMSEMWQSQAKAIVGRAKDST